MRKRFAHLMKTTFTDVDPEDLKHEQDLNKSAQILMANAKKKWLIDYQAEREQKREYVRLNVLSLGIDIEKLLKKFQAAKPDMIIPSMDDFNMTELTNLIDELKHEENIKEDDSDDKQIEEKKSGEKGGSADDSDNKSALALFDKLQAKEDKDLDDSVSSVLSSNSFRSVTTRKLKLTELNQKAFAQIYVQE